MQRMSALSALGLLLVATAVSAFETTATIERVDVEKNMLYIHANGQVRAVSVAPDIKVLGLDGKLLADGLNAKELTKGVQATVAVEREASGPIVKAIRLGGPDAGSAAGYSGKPSVGLKPLTEMTAEDRYKGEDGGLYGGGKSEPPAEQLAAARKMTSRIAARDADGNPAPDGAIGLVSISMSNATQEYSLFKQLADRDSRKHVVCEEVRSALR